MTNKFCLLLVVAVRASGAANDPPIVCEALRLVPIKSADKEEMLSARGCAGVYRRVDNRPGALMNPVVKKAARGGVVYVGKLRSGCGRMRGGGGETVFIYHRAGCWSSNSCSQR